MNTLTKGFAKRVLSMLLVTIMVFSLGIVGITSASAANVELAETGYDHTGGYIYYDNSKTNWSSSKYVYFVVGSGNSATGYQMTKVNNSNMFYLNFDSVLNGNTWSGASYFTIMMADNSWGNPATCGTYDNMKNNATVLGTYADWTFYKSNTYLITTSGSTEGTAITPTYFSSGYSAFNTSNYAYVYSTVDGTTYSSDATAGTVKISGYYFYGNGSTTTRSVSSTLGSSYSCNTTLARNSTATFEAVPADGYEFVGWYSSTTDTTADSTALKYTYTVGSSSKYMYARFEKSVSVTDATATVGSVGTAGTPVDISVTYTVDGSESTPVLTLCDANGNEVSNYTVSGDVISVTPPVAGTYTYKVKITVDGVSVFTNEVSFTYRDEFAATLSVDNTNGYIGDTFTFTVTDNSAQYGTPTYTLYNAADDSIVEEGNTTGQFTVTPDAVDTYSYYVVVSTTGAISTTTTTNTVTITVADKVFSVTLDAPEAVVEDREFTVTATVMFAPEGEELTYTLTGSDGTSYTSTDGVFTVVANTAGEVTYTVTVTASGGASVTDTAIVTVNVDLGTYPVKIFFKCSDTFGYRPNAKIDGTAVELTKSEVIIAKNGTETAEYYWYSYTSDTDVDFGTQIKFAVNANRNYFYNVSYTVSAGEGDYVLDGEGYYCYYLAVENLNGGTNTLTNISTLTEDQRNWTESAVNMIYNADTDALAETALNYSYAAYGDANCDGKLNIKDATYIQKSLAKIVETSELSAIVSDFNQDGDVTIKDATAIQKQLANL